MNIKYVLKEKIIALQHILRILIKDNLAQVTNANKIVQQQIMKYGIYLKLMKEYAQDKPNVSTQDTNFIYKHNQENAIYIAYKHHHQKIHNYLKVRLQNFNVQNLVVKILFTTKYVQEIAKKITNAATVQSVILNKIHHIITIMIHIYVLDAKVINNLFIKINVSKHVVK